ncbi:hypothetical protein EFJ93_02315 [Limosilactobacillus fermentum]|nr:hypothetical protein [Limosilactobacillus fermentum]
MDRNMLIKSEGGPLMAEKFNDLAVDIINFEREHQMIDNEIAYSSQLTVERIHEIKSQASVASEEEESLIRRFMQSQG